MHAFETGLAANVTLSDNFELLSPIRPPVSFGRAFDIVINVANRSHNTTHYFGSFVVVCLAVLLNEWKKTCQWPPERAHACAQTRLRVPIVRSHSHRIFCGHIIIIIIVHRSSLVHIISSLICIVHSNEWSKRCDDSLIFCWLFSFSFLCTWFATNRRRIGRLQIVFEYKLLIWWCLSVWFCFLLLLFELTIHWHHEFT